jgi:hypothetical protein
VSLEIGKRPRNEELHFHEIVKRDSFFEEAPLQRPGADLQLDSNVLQSRFVPCQEPLENSFRLLLQGAVGELVLQFRFQLWRCEFEQDCALQTADLRPPR